LPANRLYFMRANRTLPVGGRSVAGGAVPAAIGNPEPFMQSNQKNPSGLRKRKQRGSEMIEFTLVLLPFLGFTFLILNIAYAVYEQATIEHAVEQGVRYAITSPNPNNLGARATIQQYVAQNAFGTLSKTNGNPPEASGGTGWNDIYVDWYTIDATGGGLTNVDGITGGNCMNKATLDLPLVEVSVQSQSRSLFVPFVKLPGMGTLTGVSLGASAWDRMEAPAETTAGYQCPPQ